MKQINSILRTLCLTALLCMTSVNASAYKVYDDSFAFYSPTSSMGNERILVIDRDIETKSFATPRGEYAYIIKPGVTVTVTQFFDIGNDSKLYVFGTLLLKDGMDNQSNGGTIYIATGGTLTFNGKFSGSGTKTNVSPETILTKAKLSGQKPEPGKPGWKDCWAKGISESNDFGPVYCYEDEELKNEIPDFEAWKKGDGKLCVLQLGDDEYIHDGKSLDANVCFKDMVVYDLNVNLDVTGKITYSRTFANKNWQPLYVPFAISYDEWKGKFDVAAISSFQESAGEDDNAVEAELGLRIVKSGTLTPNTPYLIRAFVANETDPQTIEISSKKIYKSEANSISCSSIERQYTITGTYQPISELKTKGYVFMSNGKLMKPDNDEEELSPQRWYLTVASRGTSSANEMQFDIKPIGKNIPSTMLTEQPGPALKVTDQDDNEYILYAPKEIKIIKIPANKKMP